MKVKEVVQVAHAKMVEVIENKMAVTEDKMLEVLEDIMCGAQRIAQEAPDNTREGQCKVQEAPGKVKVTQDKMQVAMDKVSEAVFEDLLC